MTPILAVPRASGHFLLRLLNRIAAASAIANRAVPGWASLQQRANLHAASLDFACVQALQHLL